MDTYDIILKNGSSYTGKQTTGVGSFDIDMKVSAFNFEQGYLCGTFTVHNLTSEHNLLRTYFEGQLIGITNTALLNEIKYWTKFPCWKSEFEDGSPSYNPFKSKYLYLKIKELFLLPNPRIESVNGASIDGFYYCCYNKMSDSFGGFYQVAGTCKHGTQQIFLVRKKEKVSQSYEWA